VAGFIWLTHRANYTNFPSSLIITCVFNTQTEVDEMKKNQQEIFLINSIQKQLLKVGVVVKKIDKQVQFDSEEACEKQHNGEWDRRLALNVVKQKPYRGKRVLN
jgi:hypothetical protein